MKRCNIPSRNVGACDLEWAHEGKMHASAGDGFYAPDYDETHRHRQSRKRHGARWKSSNYVRPLMTERRFWARVSVSDACWEWKLVLKGGYAHVANGIETPHGRTVACHRAAYMFAVGPIPDGYEVDHLCFNTACVRPEHLEAVPPLVNTRRSNSLGKVERADQCANGHSLDVHGVVRAERKQPRCRQCESESSRRYIAKKKREAS
jgi:hypothetical protein